MGLGVAVVALQALDVGQLHDAVKRRFAHPIPSAFPTVLDGAVAEGRPWTVIPSYFCAKDGETRGLIAELSLLAMRHHGSINSAYTARAPGGGCETPAATKVTAAPDDQRLTMVIGHGEDLRAMQRSFAARQDCYYITPGLVCGQGLDRLPGLAPVSRSGAVDLMTDFDTGKPNPVLAAGWSDPGLAGVWSNGPAAAIVFTAPEIGPTDQLRVQLDASGFNGPQRVRLSVNAQPVGGWTVEAVIWRPYTVAVPARLVKAGAPLMLRLDLLDATQVSTVIPGSPDKRRLGVAVRRLTVTH